MKISLEKRKWRQEKPKKILIFSFFSKLLFWDIYLKNKSEYALFGVWSFLLIRIWFTPNGEPKGFVNWFSKKSDHGKRPSSMVRLHGQLVFCWWMWSSHLCLLPRVQSSPSRTDEFGFFRRVTSQMIGACILTTSSGSLLVQRIAFLEISYTLPSQFISSRELSMSLHAYSFWFDWICIHGNFGSHGAHFISMVKPM